MTDPELVVVTPEEQQQAEELGEELPAALPVLPLKETVVFPESMTPLAIGQERSIKLIDDVVGGDRLLALVTVRNEDDGDTRLGRPLRGRNRGGRAQDDPRPRRDAAHPRAGASAHQARAARARRPLSRRRVRRAARPRRGDEGARGADAQRAGPLRADHRARPLPAGGAAARRGERRRPERALLTRRVDAAAEDRGEAEAARARRRRAAAARRSR